MTPCSGGQKSFTLHSLTFAMQIFPCSYSKERPAPFLGLAWQGCDDRAMKQSSRAAMGQQQEGLPQISRPHAELSLVSHRFTQHFSQAIRALLVACPRQEFLNYFTHLEPRYQDFLHKAFSLTLAQIHANASAEFRSICEETKVLEALDHVIDRDLLGATEVSQCISPREVVREARLQRKLEEVNALKRTLQQAKSENAQVAAQLEELRAKVGEARDLRSLDSFIDKVRNANIQFAKVK